MARPFLEVADVFHHHGAAWRRANAGHLSLGQLQVMSAIENCSAATVGPGVAPVAVVADIRDPGNAGTINLQWTDNADNELTSWNGARIAEVPWR